MTDFKHLRERSATELRAIVRAYGGVLLDGGRSALIPGPGHSKADRSVSLRQLPNGRILIHCFSPRDDWRNVRDMLRDGGAFVANSVGESTQPYDVVAAVESRVTRARRLWQQAIPISGTRAEIYLRARRIQQDVWPSAFRYSPDATSIDDRRRWPALIAAIADPQGALQGVQVTLLSPCGMRKAETLTPRRIIGRFSGGAVRLFDGAIPSALIIAEGLETALSASDALAVPAWSALTAGNLARFTPPDELTHLIIAADRGPAGEAAGETLMTRMAHHRLQTEIDFAPDHYPDWNDWAQRTL